MSNDTPALGEAIHRLDDQIMQAGDLADRGLAWPRCSAAAMPARNVTSDPALVTCVKCRKYQAQDSIRKLTPSEPDGCDTHLANAAKALGIPYEIAWERYHSLHADNPLHVEVVRARMHAKLAMFGVNYSSVRARMHAKLAMFGVNYSSTVTVTR